MNRISELRKAMDIKQIDLAERLGVTQATLSNWEKGKHEPEQEKLFIMTDIFNVSLDYLLGKTDKPTPPGDDINLDELEFALFGEVKEFDEEQKKKVLEYVKFLKQQGQ